MTSGLWQNWNGNAWENSQLFIYTYDANNNQTSELSQDWNGSAWENFWQWLYTYDENNFTVDDSYKFWNDDGTVVLEGDSTYYYFHTVVGINDLTMSFESITVCPNPSSGKITIETPIEGIINILNTSGQAILQKLITEPNTTIDVSGLPSGVYVVKLVGEKGVQVGKVIKQ